MNANYNISIQGNHFGNIVWGRFVIEGYFVDADGEPPAYVIIEVGSQKLKLNGVTTDVVKSNGFPDSSGFYTRFRMGKGLKWMRIIAIDSRGKEHVIYRRLFWVIKKEQPELSRADYQKWISNYETVSWPDLNNEKSDFNPKVTFFIKGVDPDLYAQTFASIREQTYKCWEVFYVNDAVKADDPNINLMELDSKNIDDLLAGFNGQYFMVLNAGDKLRDIALESFLDRLRVKQELKIVYSDHDSIGDKGERIEPNFKPDWNLDLFYSMDYIRSAVLFDLASIRDGVDQKSSIESLSAWNLILQLHKNISSDGIYHIPRILYHSLGEDPVLCDSDKDCLLNLLAEDHSPVRVSEGLFPGSLRVNYQGSYDAKVSIIIPSKDKLDFIKPCVESIFKLTKYKNFELLIVDNGSTEEAVLEFYQLIKSKYENVEVLDYPGEFNYSAINNFAVKEANGEILLFCNNDVEVISPDWLCELVSQSQREDIGVVGAKLLYSNNTIQHAGIVLGIGDVAGHVFRHFDRNAMDYAKRVNVVGNYSAMTAACLAVRKSVFDEVGGFNEVDLKTAYNDVDLCLKIQKAGYRNLYTPYAELYHHEYVSRGNDYDADKKDRYERECQYMHQKWSHLIESDPAYNINLTAVSESYKLKIF